MCAVTQPGHRPARMGQVWHHSQSWIHLGSGIWGVSALNRLRTHTLYPGFQNLRTEIQVLTSMRRNYPKCPGKISSAPLSQPDPSVPHTDSCGGWGSSPSAPAPKCTSHLPYPACQNQNTRTLCAREEKPTQAALMPSATDRQKREAEQEQMENREFFKPREMPLYPLQYQGLSLRSAEGSLRHLQGSSCSAMAVLKPHLIFSALPALSPGHRALCSTDAELGRAKNTSTFFSLILHPVPTLQFKSQGAKQRPTQHANISFSLVPSSSRPSTWATQKMTVILYI